MKVERIFSVYFFSFALFCELCSFKAILAKIIKSLFLKSVCVDFVTVKRNLYKNTLTVAACKYFDQKFLNIFIFLCRDYE